MSENRMASCTLSDIDLLGQEDTPSSLGLQLHFSVHASLITKRVFLIFFFFLLVYYGMDLCNIIACLQE